MLRWSSIVLLVFVSLGSCTPRAATVDPCNAFFEPYSDLVSGRKLIRDQALLVKGMDHYSKGEFVLAAENLEHYLSTRAKQAYAHLYLANCYLALGRPYDAELQLDLLENSNLRDYQDQTEWYTVLCWLCSGQLDRAREGAQKIVDGRRHTYSDQASDLVQALSEPGT